MSRKGKEPIQVPKEVSVIFNDKTRELVTKGKLGDLSYNVPEKVIFDYSEQVIKLTVLNKSCRDSKRLWGLSRALVFNNVKGVSEGFTKVLIINGVGYKASVDGPFLVLSLGYSHDIYYPVPAGITIATPKPTEIRISGINKQVVGDVAAKIRNFRKPEPYKGKGIKYETETIIRKAGKRK